MMSGILILIALTSSGPTFTIALFGAVILYGLILKLYLQTAQDLKRLDGISKFVFLEVFFGLSLLMGGRIFIRSLLNSILAKVIEIKTIKFLSEEISLWKSSQLEKLSFFGESALPPNLIIG